MGLSYLLTTEAGLFILFARVMVIFTATPVHEWAHARAAYALGDDTAALQGRLDLNPFVHMDPVGSLLILLTGFGWAKPVPVRPTKFTRKVSLRGGVVLTSLAGPVSNLAMAFLLMLAAKLMALLVTLAAGAPPQQMYIMLNIMDMMAQINIGLAVFNLMPIPPLDGYNVVSYVIPGKWDYKISQLMQAPFMRLLLLLVLIEVLSWPIGWLSGRLYSLFSFLTGFLDAVTAAVM